MNGEAPVPYQVWFDLSCDDFLALPSSEMTPALRLQLSQEGVDLKTVEAASRREAVKLAFPDKSLGKSASGLIGSTGPRSSRH